METGLDLDDFTFFDKRVDVSFDSIFEITEQLSVKPDDNVSTPRFCSVKCNSDYIQEIDMQIDQEVSIHRANDLIQEGFLSDICAMEEMPSVTFDDSVFEVAEVELLSRCEPIAPAYESPEVERQQHILDSDEASQTKADIGVAVGHLCKLKTDVRYDACDLELDGRGEERCCLRMNRIWEAASVNGQHSKFSRPQKLTDLDFCTSWDVKPIGPLRLLFKRLPEASQGCQNIQMRDCPGMQSTQGL